MNSFTIVLCGGSPWGFRITGGREFNEPILISKINPNSKAYNEGVKVGDIITHINRQKTDGLNYADAQQLIKNSSYQLLLEVIRGDNAPNIHLNGGVPANAAPKLDTGGGSRGTGKPASRVQATMATPHSKTLPHIKPHPHKAPHPSSHGPQPRPHPYYQQQSQQQYLQQQHHYQGRLPHPKTYSQSPQHGQGRQQAKPSPPLPRSQPPPTQARQQPSREPPPQTLPRPQHQQQREPAPLHILTRQGSSSPFSFSSYSPHSSSSYPSSTYYPFQPSPSPPPPPPQYPAASGGRPDMSSSRWSPAESRWSERGSFQQPTPPSPDMWSKRPIMPTASPKPMRHSIKPLSLFETQPISGYGGEGSRPGPPSHSQMWGRSSSVGRGSTSPQDGAKSRGMSLFRRQQEKLAQLGADMQEINVNEAGYSHRPYEPPQVYSAQSSPGGVGPFARSLSVDEGRNVPIIVRTSRPQAFHPQPRRSRSNSENADSFYHVRPSHGHQDPEPQASGLPPWQRSGPQDQPPPHAGRNFGVGSYATLPAKSSSSSLHHQPPPKLYPQQPQEHQHPQPPQVPNSASGGGGGGRGVSVGGHVPTSQPLTVDADQPINDFDYHIYSTLPTIKPLRSSNRRRSGPLDLPELEREKKFQDYSKPLWTNTDLPGPSHGDEGHSPPSDNCVSSSDSRDTIIARSDDTRSSHTGSTTKEANSSPPKMIPVRVVHEDSSSRTHGATGSPAEFEPTDQPWGKRVVEGADQTFTNVPLEPSRSFHEKPPDHQVNGLKSPGYSSSSKQGVWSPGGVSALSPSSVKSEPVGKSYDLSSPPSASLKNLAPIWKPSGSPVGVRKEYRPVRLNTNVKPATERKPQQQEPPKLQPEESYAWQPRRSSASDPKDFSHLPASSLKYTPMSTATGTVFPPADTKPSPSLADSSGRGFGTRVSSSGHGIGASGDHSRTNGSVSDNVFNDAKNDGEIHLPSTQSPYITLLQKSRENETQGDLNFNHIGNKKPIMVSHEGQIPRGAQYLGEQVTLDGDKQHTDTYYAVPSEEKTTTTKTVEHKPVVYDGIGPVDKEGVPLAFRKNVQEENQHDWYKQMYKSLHRTEKKEDRLGINDMIDSIFEKAVKDLNKMEENKYRPTYKFPDDISDTKSEEDFNPYRPAYERNVSAKADDSGYRSEPEGRYMKDLFKRHRSTSERESREPRRNVSNYAWAPANVRSKIEVYRNQPRSIMDYEPGFSSIAIRETKTSNQFNPPIDKPGQFSQYSVGGVHHSSDHDERQDGDGADPRDTYKKVQSGGDIPAKGLQKPAPEKLREFKHQTSDVRRSRLDQGPVDPEKERRRREAEEAERKQRLHELYEEERLKKMKRGEADAEARRHHDFFMDSQKSPISPNRFDNATASLSPSSHGFLSPTSGPLSPSQPGSLGTLERKDQGGVPPERRRGFQIQGKARAVYNFNAQNPRELSFHKNDIIYLLRQVDKNWFEGERYGRVGIFPSNYVEVVTSIEAARAAAMQAEGQGRAKYNFTAQSSVEMSLRKGEFVVLLRRVDDNWFEGRISNRQGIFPVSYVEITKEPSTPLITPAPSVITTPMTGTPEMLSPVGYDAAPTPPPQPSPSALLSQRTPSTGPYGYRQQPQQSQGAHFFSGSSPLLEPSGQQYSSGFSSNPKSPNNSTSSKSPILSPGGRMGSPGLGKKSPLQAPAFNPTSKLQVEVHSKAKPYANGQAKPTKVADDDLAVTRYRALYAYRPLNEDELELQEGDEVFVMEKCDDGWYVGTSARTGCFGTFPGNYVQKI